MVELDKDVRCGDVHAYKTCPGKMPMQKKSHGYEAATYALCITKPSEARERISCAQRSLEPTGPEAETSKPALVQC